MAANRKRYLSHEEVNDELEMSDSDLETDYEPDQRHITSDTSSESDSSDTPLVQAIHQIAAQPQNVQQAVPNTWIDCTDVPDIYPFTATEEFLVNIPDQPFDVFSLFFDETVIETIVRETNRKGQEIVQNGIMLRSSIMNAWRPTNPKELKEFLALWIIMGQVKLPTLRHYWSKKNVIYEHPLIGTVMSRERFEAILRCIRLYDPDVADLDNRLHKIDHLKRILENITKVYYPGRELSLDEAMLLWRGRLVFRQYLPKKCHKYGIKFFELTTPDGFILKCMIYSGKGSFQAQNDISHAQAVVFELMKGYLGKGHALFVDNFYNSVKMTEDLGKEKTHVCGTLRKNRVGNPPEVIHAKLKKGETISKIKGNVMVMKWKDKKEVLMISNCHKHEMIDTRNRYGESKSKPNTVADYNKFMSGIDRSDQMIAYYPTPQKSIRWYMKVLFHYVDICLWNGCWVLNKTSQQNMTYLQFRDAVVQTMLKDTPLFTPVLLTSSDQAHYPEKLQKRKRCRQCSSNGKRTDTYYCCDTCKGNPGLCVAPCFKEYHKKGSP